MNRKIWKALGIAVCMLALAAPRAMAETKSHYVSNDGVFKIVIETINNSKDKNENEIILTNGFTLEGDTTEYTLRRGTTTIKGEGNTITVNPGAGIKVTGGETVLNLGAEGYAEKLTIEGDTGVAFITVSGGATAHMYENVTLQNRQQVDQACVVLEENSVFNMHGGVIQNCKGKYGGVSLKNGSRFIMEGGTISGCTTSDAGMGGGLYAYHSTITISGGTIENNKATYGGGVALNNSTINPITNWKVIGNEAYQTKIGNGGIGGGIYLDNGKDMPTMDISNGLNKIYNNQAEGHGADICLEIGASIKLPIAANMGATFGNSGINIDGWYNDNPRYEPSESGEPVKELQRSGKQSLVASYKADPVRIEIDANGGVGGSGSQTVHKGTTVTLEAPTKEGHLFKGWKDEKGNSYPAGEDGKVKITVTGAMTLTAVWEARSFTVTYVLLNGKTRTETAAYGQNVTLGEEPRTGYTFVGWKDGEKMYHAGETITVTGDMTLTAEWKKLPSAENLPKTGDESPVLLWSAALAVSAAACFMLRRKK